MKVDEPAPQFNKFLYQQVGANWEWVDRLVWSDQQWADYVCGETIHTWVAYFDGAPAGYYELDCQAEADTEIVYFGLMPEYIGKGFGGALLSSAISNGWVLGAQRIWLHTCTLDHPNALRNYQKRGLVLYKETPVGSLVPEES